MSEWKTYKLGEVGKIVTGKTPPTKDQENFGNEYPFITPVDMNGQKNVYTTARKLSEIGKQKVKNILLPKDTICVSCIGSDLGKVVKTTEPSITNQQINSIICNDYFDVDFVYYALNLLSPTLKNIGHQSTAVPIINKTDFSRFEIQAPDLATQTAIAQILTSLDDKIELNLQMNQTLEAMAQAIFKEWFVDFNFPGFDGELVDGLPKGWNRCLIKDFGKIVCGKTPSKAVKEYFGGEYMFIKIPDMHNSVFIIETTDSLTEEGVNSQSNKTIPPFSICVSSIATVGLVCINPEPCQTNQQINSIIPKNKDLRYFLYFLTTSMKDTFLATASGGTATLNMNTSQFSNIRAFMPSEDVLNEFDEIVSPIMEKILENEYNIKSLTQTRDTLLPKLMSGQLEIS